MKAALVLVLLLCGVARADDRATAKQLVADGIAAVDAGRYDEGIDKYNQAYALIPHPEILFDLGQAYRLKGDLEVALDYYEKYLAIEPKGRVSKEAKKWKAELPPKIEAANKAKAKALEEARIAEEERKAEAARLAEEARVAAEAREAEDARQAAEARKAREAAAEEEDQPPPEEEAPGGPSRVWRIGAIAGAGAAAIAGGVASVFALSSSGSDANEVTDAIARWQTGTGEALDADDPCGDADARLGGQNVSDRDGLEAVASACDARASHASLGKVFTGVSVGLAVAAGVSYAQSTAGPGRHLRVAGVSLVGAGVLALGAGATYGLIARAIDSDLSGQDTAWTEEQLGRYADGNRAEKRMLTFTLAGAALVGGGATLYVLGHRKAHASVALTPTSISLAGIF